MTLSTTNRQGKILICATRVSAALSLMGSSFIIMAVLKHRKRKLKTTYNRLVLLMSCIDLLVSVWYFVSAWAVPTDAKKNASIIGKGNQATCSAQGFFIQLGTAIPLYNLSLCLYYVLIISYNWKKAELVLIERYMHSIAWIFGIGTAVACLPLNLYNPMGSVCWIDNYPSLCGHDGSIECIRGGGHASVYRLAFRTIPVLLCAIIDVIALFKVYCTVRKQEKVVKRLRRGSHTSERKNLTKEVANQALFFFLTFFVTWTPSTVTNFVLHFKYRPQYWVIALVLTVTPMQGFWNFLVYVRPRYLRYRRAHPCCSQLHIAGLSLKQLFGCQRIETNEDMVNAPSPGESDKDEQNEQLPVEKNSDSEEDLDPSVDILSRGTDCPTSVMIWNGRSISGVELDR